MIIAINLILWSLLALIGFKDAVIARWLDRMCEQFGHKVRWAMTLIGSAAAMILLVIVLVALWRVIPPDNQRHFTNATIVFACYWLVGVPMLGMVAGAGIAPAHKHIVPWRVGCLYSLCLFVWNIAPHEGSTRPAIDAIELAAIPLIWGFIVARRAKRMYSRMPPTAKG